MPEHQPHDDLERFLVRAVLDAEFCALARRDPDAAFTGYALSDEDRQTLRAGDEGVLRLLGRALRGAAPAGPEREPTPAAGDAAGPAAEAVAPIAPVQPVPLQPVSLLVTIQPFAISTPAGVQLSFGASIAPAATAAVDAAPRANEAPAGAAGDAASPSPWEHDLGSQRTRDAAAAVHAAAAGERRECILALLATMTSREQIGGDGDAPDG